MGSTLQVTGDNLYMYVGDIKVHVHIIILCLCLYVCSWQQQYRHFFVHEYIASLLILVIYDICAFTTSVLLQLLFTEIFVSKVGNLSFSSFSVRLLLHSTLAVAETLLLAGELLPFGKRQP